MHSTSLVYTSWARTMATFKESPSRSQGRSINLKSPIGTAALFGGVAGVMEAVTCHPLDTIKVRLQSGNNAPSQGLSTAKKVPTGIVSAAHAICKESPTALYRGLSPVVSGIVPKLAVRFTSFDLYSGLFRSPGEDKLSFSKLFLVGLATGVTEAVVVVTPAEVIKIQQQTARRGGKSMGMFHTARSIVQNGGLKALWTGAGLTAARQGTNQAGNFFAYQTIRQQLLSMQPQYEKSGLPVWQTALNGFLAGCVGPALNSPLDTLKTRAQKRNVTDMKANTKQSSWWRQLREIARTEGYSAMYRGAIPRLLRVGLGQSVVFCTYEFLRGIYGSGT
ncbi:Mitochondrial succinate-fumarate transporter [Gnomoniopsis smithogilvyi]|uniref:Mitochondrial succinate-fumarate transporter n=1 Tax=Gnomoniopsis smithogilvyi TaxID=1191159 RepID=A0A9W9CU98_9PEZI|nr:Mitochondrial succinate-fumarate transporter [Gnomoniopsis smithogilvyi]